MAPKLTHPDEPRSLYGVARLPRGDEVVCTMTIVREIDDGTREPHDWVDLSLPTGALGRVEHRVGGFPFANDAESLPWRRPIDEWFAGMARQVFMVAPFRVALIGFEVSGNPIGGEIDAGVPEERWVGYVLPVDGELRFLPANR